jgi:hypothetical protein
VLDHPTKRYLAPTEETSMDLRSLRVSARLRIRLYAYVYSSDFQEFVDRA